MDFKERHSAVFAISFFVAGFVIGFFSYAFFVDKSFFASALFVKEKTRVPSSDGEQGAGVAGGRTLRERSLGLNPPPPPPKALGKNVIVVAPQSAGGSVVLSLASLSVSGWIAIREDAGSGMPGIILGARRFDVGDFFGEPIELLRNTEEGRTYFAVLHHDDGDVSFDYTAEVPYVDASGETIKEQFLVTFGADE